MKFEILDTENEETVIVEIDVNTFNQILKMLVVESYHMGAKKYREKDEIEDQ